MSVTICWRPASDKGKSFEGGTSSSFDTMKETFGSVIQPSDVVALRAMARAARDEFYNEVADIVENVGAIEVWGEY